jgi:hypothetical protein
MREDKGRMEDWLNSCLANRLFKQILRRAKERMKTKHKQLALSELRICVAGNKEIRIALLPQKMCEWSERKEEKKRR